jgi:hypothetical protein
MFTDNHMNIDKKNHPQLQRNGTKRNEMKRNLPKRNGTERNKMKCTQKLEGNAI